MKKLLFIITIVVLHTNLYSQINLKNIKNIPTVAITTVSDPNTPPLMGGDEILWSEDFEDIDNVTTEDIAGFGDWKWSDQAPSGQWSANSQVIESETPNNGFMLMEADFYNTSPQNNVAISETGENQIHAQFTIGPIDLSSSETEQLVLQFYSNYRICCYYSPSENNDLNVYISTDGGEIYSDLNYIEGDIYEVNEQKNILSQIPLSNFAANTTDVYFKFEWIGTHYFWMIDDIAITQRPEYDVKMQSGWIAMKDPANIEYYSIPTDQMPDSMLIGAEIYNYGYENDTVNLIGSIQSEGIYSSIENVEVLSDSTNYIETPYFDVSNLTTGTYNFQVEVSSMGEDISLDNTYNRNFKIHPTKYALGGLYENVDYYGTGISGSGTADGFRLANYFDIKTPATLSSILVDLSTGQEFNTSSGIFETIAGGELIAYVCDTTGLYGSTEPFGLTLGGILEDGQSDFYLITPNDINNGYAVIDMQDFNLEIGAYYIVIEMYSNNLLSNIIIRDDKTVVQPYYASMMWSPEDNSWYTNPNALGIELGLNGNTTGLSSTMEPIITYFPNPSNGFLEISTNVTLSGKCEIKLYNMLGEIVLNEAYDNFNNRQILNLKNINTGSYIIEFLNNFKTNKQVLIIK